MDVFKVITKIYLRAEFHLISLTMSITKSVAFNVVCSALRRNEADDTSDSSATIVLLASIDDAIDLATMQKDPHCAAMPARQSRAAAARRALGMVYGITFLQVSLSS